MVWSPILALLALLLAAPLALATSTWSTGLDGGSRLRGEARGSLTPGTTDRQAATRDRVSTMPVDAQRGASIGGNQFGDANADRFPGVFRGGGNAVTAPDNRPFDGPEPSAAARFAGHQPTHSLLWM